MEAEAPKKRRKMVFVVIALVVVAGAAGAYFFLLGGDGDEAEATPTTTTTVAEGAIIAADPMTFNLADEDELRYARLTFAVVLPMGVDSGEVGERLPLLQDAALSVVSGYTSAELRTGDGLDRLRGELTDEAHDVFPDGEVLRVVLTEVLVQ